jgi:Uncharacterized protein conserved in bacteria (DUF2188)
MAERFVHTVHRDGKINEIAAGDRASSTHKTKEETVKAGRDLARNRSAEQVIHDLDGEIGQRNSYGNDPASHPG